MVSYFEILIIFFEHNNYNFIYEIWRKTFSKHRYTPSLTLTSVYKLILWLMPESVEEETFCWSFQKMRSELFLVIVLCGSVIGQVIKFSSFLGDPIYVIKISVFQNNFKTGKLLQDDFAVICLTLCSWGKYWFEFQIGLWYQIL